MTRSRSVLLFVATVGACLLPLTHRVLWHGEFHSVSELIFSSYPWAYDDPSRTPLDATNFDLAVFDYPLLKTHWGRLKAGDFPDWDPLLIGGGPAFFQQLNTGQAFSPVHLPLYLLPFDLGYTVSVWMRPVGAASLMYLFLRHAGVGTAGTIAGAVALGFTGPFTVSLASAIPAVGLFLPLTILLAERVARFCRAIDVAALGIVLGLQFTVVYLPTSIVVVATTMAYAAWWIDRDAWRRTAVGLGIAGVGAIAVGAVALVPMLVSLSASPVLDRSMADVRPLVSDLVTFALPGFWGNPRSHNWWHPAGGHYREVVQYLGVVPLIFAGAGAAWAIQRRERRGLFFAGLAAMAMLYMYDVPPVAWLRDLPGLRPMNPLRANVALAIASAALTAYGVDWLAQRAHAADRRERRVIMASTLLVGLALASTAALVTYHYLPTIRNLHLQDFEKRGLARFAILAVAALALVVVAVRSSPRQTQAASGGAAAGPIRLSLVGFVAVLLIATDLVHAAWGLNPTQPRSRIYPETPGLTLLRGLTGAARVVPAGGSPWFIQGHVFSIYNIPTVTGTDFRGDTRLQRFLQRAGSVPPQPGQFSYLGFRTDRDIDLKLLGLLNVGFVATPPVDAATMLGGFETVGELTAGRVARQTFISRHTGLRRVDVLTATFDRANEGILRLSIRDVTTDVEVASRVVPGAAVPNIGWVSLEFAPVQHSRGRKYAIELRAIEGVRNASATALASQTDGYEDGHLVVDGRPTSRDLWFRTFAEAPDRWPDATLIFSRDLNIYRNSRAQPRAWFVRRVAVETAGRHLDRIAAPGFDPADTVLLEAAPRGLARVGGTATVTRVDIDEPDVRTISVSAPNGGVLVISERYDRGWRASVDGAPAPVIPANDILMAVVVPPGAREVRLDYRMLYVRAAAGVSALALGAFVLAAAVWRHRTLPG